MPYDHDPIYHKRTKKMTDENSEYTERELRIAERFDYTPEEARKRLQKDRLLEAAEVLDYMLDQVKADPDMSIIALVEQIIERFELNEREAHSFATTLQFADRLGSAGFGIAALAGMFQMGAEFAKAEEADYTDEDHEKWLEITQGLQTFAQVQQEFKARQAQKATPHGEDPVHDMTSPNQVEESRPLTPAEIAMMRHDPEAG